MQSNNLVSKCLPDHQQRLKESSRYQPLHEDHVEEVSLKSIHDRLQEETDKIVRWKISTEVSLNQKERQLKEYQKVIESLRNNLFEQQMKNENLSHNLLREKEERELIEDHTNRTRNLCNALIQRYQELEVIINEYTVVRDQLETFNDDVKSQCFSLSEKYTSLTTKHESIVKRLESEAESKISVLNNELENMKDYIFLKENELEKRKDEDEIKSLVIKDLSQKCFLLGEKLESVIAKCNWTVTKLEKVEKKSLNDKQFFEDKLAQFESSTENLQSELSTTNERLCESRLEFEEAAERVKYLQECNSSLERKTTDLFKELEAVKIFKNNAEKEVEMTSQKLEEMITISSENEKTLRIEILNLENTLISCRNELQEKKNQLDDLEKNCEKDRENFIVMEDNLKQQSQSLQEEIKTKNAELENLLNELNQSHSEYEKIIEEKGSLDLKVEHLNQNSNELKEALTLKENKLMLIEEENTEMKNQITEQASHILEILENEKTLSASKDDILKENFKLKEEIDKLGLEKKELEKSFNSGKKNLNIELKKNDKLKTRLQNLENKLKATESSTESKRENFEKVIEELKTQLEESKNCYNELKITSDNFREESDVAEKNLRDELEKTKSDLKAAEKISEENEAKAKMAEKEATSRVREMMELSEIFKKESETAVAEKNKENEELRKELDQVKDTLLQTQQAQDVLLTMKSKLEDSILEKNEEFLSVSEKLASQTEEFNHLKAAIKSLTTSPRRSDDNESLRTPSPSQYLPLFKNSMGNISSSNENRLRAPLKNQHSILKQNSSQRERQTSKAVTFLSPVFRAPDSDSSDGFAVDIQSDTDEKFDAIRRSSNVRFCRPVFNKDIPKANITPISRAVVTEKDPEEKSNDVKRGGPAFKRPRYDKTAMKTYTSPKAKQV